MILIRINNICIVFFLLLLLYFIFVWFFGPVLWCCCCCCYSSTIDNDFIVCAFTWDLIKKTIQLICGAVVTTTQVLVLLFAVIACAVAIPAALPQPDSSAAAPGAPVSVEERQRSALEKRQVGLENGSEQAEDLKASSSYGYGYYGHHGGYYGGPYRPYGNIFF